MNLLGRHEREAFIQVKTHLVTKDAFGPGAGAVGLGDTVAVHVLHEVFVLAANGAHKGIYVNKLARV